MSTAMMLRPGTTCTACHAPLLAPEWFESREDHEVVRLWHCPVCGTDFETVDADDESHVSDAEAIEDFWPTLLVA